MKIKSLEETCIGHVTYWKKNCIECKKDYKNKYCKNYVPMKVFYVGDKK